MRRTGGAEIDSASRRLSSIFCSPSLTRTAWKPKKPPSFAAFAAACAASSRYCRNGLGVLGRGLRGHDLVGGLELVEDLDAGGARRSPA